MERRVCNATSTVQFGYCKALEELLGNEEVEMREAVEQGEVFRGFIRCSRPIPFRCRA
jgi:hypothetical protein